MKDIKEKIINSKLIIIVMIMVLIGVITVPSIFASLQPVKSIEIISSKSSYTSKEGGAWKATNSVEFISSNTALVTMDLDTISKGSSKYKDVVFLIDTSESMVDEKFSTLKSGVANSINSILNNTNNKVGIVSFNSSATLVSSLSNNKSDLINKVSSLTKENGTSYYQALLEVENILKIYTLSEDREFNVILITDGAPSKDRPNDVALYKYLKDAYSSINIRGVQYEAGVKTLTELENVSDKQYITNMSNIERHLISSATSSNAYESFTIKENLNNENFNIESINDIKVDTGSVELNNNVITWNLDNIGSGSKANMTFKAKLKNTSNGVYELNNNIEVNSTIGGVIDTVTSPKTPVLSNNYKVKYDGNKPSDCTISGVPSDTTHKVFETVSIADSPKCNGYQFKGWDIVTDNVTKINDDYFIMPEADVTLKANWSKLNIRKSTEGKVSQGLTLYGQILNDSKDSTKYVKKYTGDTSTFKGEEDIYYYYGAAANNNVIFANYCWKIVRTTDTGGVKLLYNGVPSNGKCANTGEASSLTADEMKTTSNKVAFNSAILISPSNVGYMNNIKYPYQKITFSKQDLSGSIKLSTTVSKNGESYTLENPVTLTLNDWKSNYTKYKNYYTCGTDATSCTADSLKYIVEPYTSNVVYLPFNKLYKYGNSFTYENGTYNLVNTIDNLPDSTHHYTCLNTSGNCSTISFIYNLRVDFMGLFYISMNNGKNITDILNDMLNNTNVNRYDSTIKSAIDTWYKNNMTEYTSYLEDTIWCNDRSIYNKNGWDPNGNNLYYWLSFNSQNPSNNLVCPNRNDQFTVDSTNGNGALTYPVGLVTKQELSLARVDGKSPLTSNSLFWSLSPSYFFDVASNYVVFADNTLSMYTVGGTNYIRPSISLAKGCEFSVGNGSSDNPYVIVYN